MSKFRTTRTSGVERVRETLFSSHFGSHCSEGSHGTGHRPAAATEGSRRRAVPDSLVTVPGELTLDRSFCGRRFQASMSRIKIQSPPGGWWCHPARQAGGNECLDHGCEPGLGG